MGNEEILTPEDIAENLMVPVETVMTEIYSGRLQAMQIGSFIRIRGIDFGQYKNKAADLLRSGTSWANSVGSSKPEVGLRPAQPFEHVWPDGKKEVYTDVVEGTVSDGTRERHVKIGFTMRQAAGMNRRRVLVVVDRYATVEFVGANDFAQSHIVASVIKDNMGRQIPVGGRVPAEYLDANLDIAAYRETVDGPRASANLGVICKDDDFQAMIKHALIRTKYNEQDQK